MENLKTILLILITFLAVYLLGAFYSASFNISNWTDVTRFTVVLLGAFACFITLIINKITI